MGALKKLLTNSEIRFIKRNRLKMSSGDMAKALTTGDGIIQRYLRDHRLKVPKSVWIKFRQAKLKGRSILSPEEDVFITDNYLALPVKFMADVLGRGDGLVQRRVRQLGLKIPKWLIENRKLESQLKPGNIPINKGKKQKDYMSAESIERTKATRFKKGEIPPNKLHFKDGDITIRQRTDRNEKPHKYIRISLRIWKELQIYNWENEKGPIPKGFVLACKNGDTLNCDPSNWFLMSKVENMKRNSSSVNLKDGFIAYTIATKKNPELVPEILKHKKLIELKRNQILLKRTIHEQQEISKTA